VPAGAAGAADVPVGHVLGGWGSGLNFNWEGVFGLNLPGFITIADFGLPVGLGGVPFFEPSIGLPTLDAGIGNEAITGIPPQIDRRDITSDPGELPQVLGLPVGVETVGWGGPGVVVAATNELRPFYASRGSLSTAEVAELRDLGHEVIWREPTPQTIVATEDDDVSWIEDIYTTVDASVFGGNLPGGAPQGGQPLAVTTGVPATVGTPTVIAQPGTPAAVPNPAIKSYCYKFKDGVWQLVKMRRRRRKQLATKGDLQDLAALKGILGTGKAFEVWIATHS